MSDDASDARASAAARTLALLNAQADAVRADLAAMRRELAQGKEQLLNLRTVQLLEVNEQLVQAAVQADSAAQTAVSSLDELTRLTQHDELTGAPKRALMLDRVESAIAMARRHSTRLAVMFVDLDRFKPINDTLGHAVGDQVLQWVARQLESAVRDSDSVSRHGGDEFVVLLAEIASPGDAASVARKILEALAEPALVGPHRLSLSASLGIAVYPEDGADAAALIESADSAMYESKKRGAGGFAFGSDEADYAGDEAGPAAASADGAGRAAAAVAAPASRRPDSKLAQHEARLRELLEANRQLVGAAQTAQKLQAHAEEAHQRQINFVVMASHALRTPLSAIRMATASLAHPKLSEPVRVRQHERIERQTTQMVRLIDDLLDGSRVGAGEFRLRRSEVRLDVMLNVALDACRHVIDAKEQRLSVELPDEPALVNGDPQRLTQVFSNLLNNASRRARPGGAVAVTMRAEGDELVVSVANDGVGIAAEAMARVFDLFAVDHNVPPDESGLGIGLAVVQELVRAHGGTVSVRSAGEAHGSEFEVRLPRSPGSAG